MEQSAVRTLELHAARGREGIKLGHEDQGIEGELRWMAVMGQLRRSSSSPVALATTYLSPFQPPSREYLHAKSLVPSVAFRCPIRWTA